MSPKRLYEGLLILVTVVWGLGFVLTKNALDAVGPITFMSWRFTVAAVLISLFCLRRRFILESKRSLAAGILVGSLLATGYIFQTIGLRLTTNGKTAFITGLQVVFIPLFATFTFTKKPRLQTVICTIIAAIGLGFLTLGQNWQINDGDLWVLGCAIFFALHIIANSYFCRRHDPLVLATQQIIVVAVITTLASFIIETPDFSKVPQLTTPILVTAVLCTAFAFYILTKAQQYISSTRTGLILILEAVFGAMFGWLLAGETLGIKGAIGCTLILCALVYAQLAPQELKT